MILLILIIVLTCIYYILKNTPLLYKIKHICLVCIVSFLVLSIIKYPQQAFEAAKLGINTWFNVVFPALLPFFIGAELLIGLGVVNFIGILLEPIIRPIFNVPGEGSFVLAMSITSGYPIGVKLATQLRNKGIFSRIETQRLISFCSTSGPLFMIGAVSIGMFHNLQLGTTIALSHYLGAITTGILFRFYKFKHKRKNSTKKQKGYIKRAFCEMFKVVQNKESTFGALLGTSVKNSMETLFIIGGFIILFSVIIQLLTIIGLIDIFSNYIQKYLYIFHLDASICRAIVSGIFEITMGCKLLSEISNISFIQQAVLATMIISWSGFSIHAQASSLLSKTDISTGIYIFSKFLHAILSGFFVFLIVPITHSIFSHINTPVFFQYSIKTTPTWTSKILFSSKLFMIMTISIIVISIVLQIMFLLAHTLSKINKK
ncbi:sporulation integral membrane protein YlbJ [Crassaminicella thermophila]|nr:sporulation integral membrane protein YlbJ [Crassaminicella thermophila]